MELLVEMKRPVLEIWVVERYSERHDAIVEGREREIACSGEDERY